MRDIIHIGEKDELFPDCAYEAVRQRALRWWKKKLGGEYWYDDGKIKLEETGLWRAIEEISAAAVSNARFSKDYPNPPVSQLMDIRCSRQPMPQKMLRILS